jgi:drug/metabolite transporter (DMT)-like permease
MVYLLVFLVVAAMAAVQLLVKKALLIVGPFPGNLSQAFPFFLKVFTNFYFILGIVITVLAALVWILVVSKMQISYLYPFIALSYVLVALFSMIFFKEDVTALRWIGIVVICAGVFLVARS